MHEPDTDLKWTNTQGTIEHNLIKWRLIINQELYDNHLIDAFTFHRMEESLISRLTKIKNNK